MSPEDPQPAEAPANVRRFRTRSHLPSPAAPPTRWRASLATADRFLRAGRTGWIWAAVAAVAYLTLLSGYLLTHGSWPTPDILVPPLLIIALLLGRPIAWLVDWLPLLVLLLLWQMLAGVADPDNLAHAHLTDLLDAERRLFGGVLPTVALQQGFHHPGRLAWYDWAATFMHGAHFAVPVGVAFILWARRRADYWRFASAALLMSYIALVVYWRYPAEPPWMAAAQGATGGDTITRIVGETLGQFPATVPLGWFYQQFSPNDVAAIPSLHAAFPLLITLTLWRLRPRWAPLALLYTLVMSVAVVYLGEHYVIDVLAGWGAAAAAFLLVWLAEVGLRPIRQTALPLARRIPWCMRPARPAPPVPRWARAARGGLYPGIPLVVLLIVMAGPLGFRPSSRLISALPPPPTCAETPSAELPDVAAEAHSVADQVLLIVVDANGPACYTADPDGLLPAEEASRAVRVAGLYRLATDDSEEWDPAVPDGAVTVRERVTVPAASETAAGARVYSVLVVLSGPHDPDTVRDAAGRIAEEAVSAVRGSEGG